MGNEAASIVAKQKREGLHDTDPPDVDQRTAAYWWGARDEDIQSALTTANLIAVSPVAQMIYLARVADDGSKNRAIKEWAYETAAEFVGRKGSGQRRRSMVENYQLDWGRQAARDGVARALWPEWVDEMPGRDIRCRQFNVGHQAYQRVRDHVMREALDLFVAFRSDVECLMANRWTQDMRYRWEKATGANWADATH